MTFTHQMIRLFIVEQLYRADQILQGKPYHNDWLNFRLEYFRFRGGGFAAAPKPEILEGIIFLFHI